MPYIKTRERFQALVEDMHTSETYQAGDLNYLISHLVLNYIEHNGMSYQTCVEIEGVLSHVSKELYRRRVGPYEDEKIAQNGDIEGYAL